VATPLLAGFAITVIAIVLQTPNTFRWSDWVLLLLTIASGSLITSVQAGHSAQAYLVTPYEAAEWWPDPSESIVADLEAELLAHKRAYDHWVAIQAFTYHLGVVALLSGIAVALVPPTGIGVSSVRWIAVALACLFVAIELSWILGGWIVERSAGHSRRVIRFWAVKWSRIILRRSTP
jgi:hypothetical protein